MRISLKIVALGTLASLLAGPALSQDATAHAEIKDMEGASWGTLVLEPGDGGVRIQGTLAGVPQGTHGFHIHETGECDPETMFESAGAHLNPADMQHGLENPEGPHAGDLQNIESIAEGQAAVDVTTDRVTLGDGGDADLLDDDGSAIVVHAETDDQQTDPSGNSGDRIACGVIEAQD